VPGAFAKFPWSIVIVGTPRWQGSIAEAVPADPTQAPLWKAMPEVCPKPPWGNWRAGRKNAGNSPNR
jgi:hypothetical protein